MARYNKYGFIVELDENEIFVFGSNLAGRHGKGAAKQAYDQFGAEYGVGEGLTGQCYAFPTLDDRFLQLDWYSLIEARNRFYNLCYLMEDTKDKHVFLLTKVGCGLAGFTENEMARLFATAPSNVVKPKGW